MVNAILKKALVFFIPIILIACESKSTGETIRIKADDTILESNDDEAQAEEEETGNEKWFNICC